jgi:hypothetical protein
MKSVVFYASRKGNTRLVAEAIAEGLRASGSTEVVSLDDGPASIEAPAAAAFDTRVNWPRLLSGAAADGIAKRLQTLGARLVVPPESFIVSTKPELLPGELERARAWGASLAENIQYGLPTTTRAAG